MTTEGSGVRHPIFIPHRLLMSVGFFFLLTCLKKRHRNSLTCTVLLEWLLKIEKSERKEQLGKQNGMTHVEHQEL